MNRQVRLLLVLARAFLLSALVAMTFSGCSLLGAAIQLVGKAVDAVAGNTADAIPMRVNVSIPIEAEAPAPAAVDPVPAESGEEEFPD